MNPVKQFVWRGFEKKELNGIEAFEHRYRLARAFAKMEN
jgi:hypothetical protein